LQHADRLPPDKVLRNDKRAAVALRCLPDEIVVVAGHDLIVA
jgi:hypothetical protein